MQTTENSLKFEWFAKRGTQDVSAFRLNAEPQIYTIKGKKFTYGGHEFAWINKAKQHDLEWMNFLAIKSGRGFRVSLEKNTMAAAESGFINFVENTDKFFETVEKQKDLHITYQEELERLNVYNSQNAKRMKTLINLTKQTNVTFTHDKTLLATGKVTWDIVKTDNNLKKQFGFSYPDNMSMSDFILKQFGKEIHEQVKTLI